MTFEAWLRMQAIGTLDLLSREGIIGAMHTAWQAGLEEGYRQGYSVAKHTEALAPLRDSITITRKDH